MQMQIGAVRADYRDAGVFVAKLGKMHTPREQSRFSPAAAGRKTALSAKRLTQSEAGSKGIGDLPKRQFVKPHQKNNCKKSADQSAVKNAAGA